MCAVIGIRLLVEGEAPLNENYMYNPNPNSQSPQVRWHLLSEHHTPGRAVTVGSTPIDKAPSTCSENYLEEGGSPIQTGTFPHEPSKSRS